MDRQCQRVWVLSLIALIATANAASRAVGLHHLGAQQQGGRQRDDAQFLMTQDGQDTETERASQRELLELSEESSGQTVNVNTEGSFEESSEHGMPQVAVNAHPAVPSISTSPPAGSPPIEQSPVASPPLQATPPVQTVPVGTPPAGGDVAGGTTPPVDVVTSSSGTSTGVSSGAVAGIVIGVVAGTALIAGIGMWVVKRRRSPRYYESGFHHQNE